MHIQAKTTPAASPADLAALARPARESPPGSTDQHRGRDAAPLETGGQFVFSFDHDRRADVEAVLDGYHDPSVRATST